MSDGIDFNILIKSLSNHYETFIKKGGIQHDLETNHLKRCEFIESFYNADSENKKYKFTILYPLVDVIIAL